MRRITALALSLALLFSACALSAAALTPKEMNEELKAIKEENPDSKSGMMVAWDFDDMPTVTKEYVKDAYEEAKKLSESGGTRYILTDTPEEEIAAYEIDGLCAVRLIENRDKTRAVTVYKFDTLLAAAAYAEVLLAKHAPEEGEEAEVYVRQCGYTVVEGEKALASLVGVTVVDSVVPVNNPPKDIYSYYSGGTPCGEEGCADCEAGVCEKYAIYDDAYTALGASNKGSFGFKTPDSAIRMVDGALIIGQKYKDYHTTAADLPSGMSSYEGYMSADAYADIYPSNLGYTQLHKNFAGESFVFSIRMKAPYDYLSEGATGKISIFTPRSNFSVKINGEEKKVVFDQNLIKYDTATKEVLICSAGTEMRTGIYLSEYDYSTIAVHVNPKSNSYDFYADGILVAKGVTFLSAANIAKIHSDPYAEPTGNLADYTLTRARVFHTTRTMLNCELLYIDNLALYYADEYLEKCENEDTVGGISASLGDNLYMNYYLKFPESYATDFNTKLVFEAKGHTEESMVVDGERVAEGEYKGFFKYSFPLDADDLTGGVSLKLESVSGTNLRTLYFYGDTAATNGFLGVNEYSHNPSEYFKYLSDERNGFDAETRGLSRAVINHLAAVIVYRMSEKYGGTEIQLQNMPNAGLEYTEAELSAVTKESFTAMIKSENKTQTTEGKVTGLSVRAVVVPDSVGKTLSFTLKYTYTGKAALTVDGEPSVGEVEIDATLYTALDDYYALFTTEGEWARVCISPFAAIADNLDADGTKSYEKKLFKSVYYLKAAFDAYCAK